MASPGVTVVADPRMQAAEPSERTRAGPVTEACSFASESHVYAEDPESPRTEGGHRMV